MLFFISWIGAIGLSLVGAVLNVANFFFFIMIVTGPVCGFAAANSHHAGLVSMVIFVLGGLLVGFGVGMLSGKLAYIVLSESRMPELVRLVLYLLIPVVGLFLVVLIPFITATMFYGFGAGT